MGTAALVLGILGLLSFWTLIGGIVLGLLGLIFGVIGRKRAARGEASNGGMALAGAITGGIALALSVVIIAIAGVFFLHHKTDIQKLRDCLSNAPTSSDRQQCQDDFRTAVAI
jgi:prepilin signal peptidase PulO-like enzyme (type II secretory pathway)